MRGEPGVIDYLNKGLRHELTAVNQYWLHHRLLDNWGYKYPDFPAFSFLKPPR
jgi:bacterioferritin